MLPESTRLVDGHCDVQGDLLRGFDLVLRPFVGFRPVEKKCPGQVIRITSYNVCYTKLLRTEVEALRNIDREGLEFASRSYAQKREAHARGGHRGSLAARILDRVWGKHRPPH